MFEKRIYHEYLQLVQSHLVVSVLVVHSHEFIISLVDDIQIVVLFGVDFPLTSPKFTCNRSFVHSFVDEFGFMKIHSRDWSPVISILSILDQIHSKIE